MLCRAFNIMMWYDTQDADVSLLIFQVGDGLPRSGSKDAPTGILKNRPRG